MNSTVFINHHQALIIGGRKQSLASLGKATTFQIEFFQFQNNKNQIEESIYLLDLLKKDFTLLREQIEIPRYQASSVFYKTQQKAFVIGGLVNGSFFNKGSHDSPFTVTNTVEAIQLFVPVTQRNVNFRCQFVLSTQKISNGGMIKSRSLASCCIIQNQALTIQFSIVGENLGSKHYLYIFGGRCLNSKGTDFEAVNSIERFEVSSPYQVIQKFQLVELDQRNVKIRNNLAQKTTGELLFFGQNKSQQAEDDACQLLKFKVQNSYGCNFLQLDSPEDFKNINPLTKLKSTKTRIEDNFLIFGGDFMPSNSRNLEIDQNQINQSIVLMKTCMDKRRDSNHEIAFEFTILDSQLDSATKIDSQTSQAYLIQNFLILQDKQGTILIKHL